MLLSVLLVTFIQNDIEELEAARHALSLTHMLDIGATLCWTSCRAWYQGSCPAHQLITVRRPVS